MGAGDDKGWPVGVHPPICNTSSPPPHTHRYRERAGCSAHLKHARMPAGASSVAMCRSVKYEDQEGGWCSDTEAMMGMYLEA